jgi:putative endonuclease
MQRKQYYVYIVSSYIKAIYIGCSSDLLKRVYQHKTKTNADSHTALYNINRLVYYEIYEDSYNANCRERQLKKWNRSKR